MHNFIRYKNLSQTKNKNRLNQTNLQVSKLNFMISKGRKIIFSKFILMAMCQKFFKLRNILLNFTEEKKNAVKKIYGEKIEN